MRSSIVKVFFGTGKQKNSVVRNSWKNQILTGYLSEEIHRKIRLLNKKKANIH
ncbi:hypothetical protein ACFL3D_00030 [Candidatus Omnitrophota bacterium]